MEEYYRRRAEEYDEIYYRNDPVWQGELNKVAQALKAALRNKKVLEIACGTGYWTRFLSETARSIVATDIAQEMLEIAQRKQYRCPISFRREDAYNLPFEDKSFDGGLANFWLSHVPKSRIDSFLKGFHRVLQSGSKVFMADNVYILGIGGKLVTREGEEDTYKLRGLKDGSEHLVLKNYLSAEELIEIFSKYDRGFSRDNIIYGNYFWYLIYELR
jgi:ubiquinone/menaquinone biosynthesis C-methylase UbiE